MAQAAAQNLSPQERQAVAQAIEAAVALHRRGRLDEAERLYAGVLKLAPAHFDALHLLGLIRQKQGDNPEALRLIEAALQSGAATADAYSNHGKILMQLKRYGEALKSFEQALARVPGHGSALVGRAAIRIRMQDHAGALADAERAAAADEANARAWCVRGEALTALKRRDEAIESYGRALALEPGLPEALINRGGQLREAGDAVAAIADYETLLASDPRNAKALINRGHALVDLQRDDEAIESYVAAFAAGGHPDAKANEAMNRIRLGQFAAGWDAYEWRWQTDEYAVMRRDYPQPLWDGAPMPGRLLVSAEQGLGDHILFGTMLPDLRDRVGALTVEVDLRLVPLFARSISWAEFVAYDHNRLHPGPADAHIPMGSLGRFLRRDPAEFAAPPDGHLRCDEARAAALRERLDDGRLIVGVSWHSQNKKLLASKSVRLADLAAVFGQPQCRLVDLQYGDNAAERAAVVRDLGVTVEKLPDVDNTDDIDGLAALIRACDVVVTVSNTTAHLAGAIGAEAHVLVASGRGRMWCWMKDRDDSPWYPRVRLWRQHLGQPWPEVVAAAGAAVMARAENRGR